LEIIAAESPSNCETWQGRTDRIAAGCIFVLIAYTTVENVLAAASRPFWYDELLTVAVARQPNLSALWTGLVGAKDSSPLLYILIEHLSGLLVPNAQVAYRLPSVVGFGLVVWCLFAFIRKRAGSICAFLCAMIPLLTPLYGRYACEARSYSLVVACIAIALVCYQRAPKRSWIVLLGLALSGAEAFHYYAFFSFPAFFLAELAWTADARKIRWGIWLALTAGFLPLAASWPLLAGLKRYYGADYWGRPTFAVVVHAYDGFFGPSVLRVLPGLGFVLAAALSILAILTAPIRESSNDQVATTYTSYEPLLAVGLLTVPFVAFAATSVGHGVFTGRYLLSMTLGVAIAASYALRPFRNQRLVPFVLIAFMLAGVSRKEFIFWASEHRNLASFSSPTNSIELLLSSAGRSNLPVVVSDGQGYVELSYYAPASLAKRLVVIVDPPNAILYAGNDAVDRGILALRCCLALNVYHFRDFTMRHPSFLLYSGKSNFDWWPARLRKDGYLLETVASNGNEDIYSVRRPFDSH
jgi:4-amino-4-deoxy-L-arabinose transferase-like glycosyltransferase